MWEVETVDTRGITRLPSGSQTLTPINDPEGCSIVYDTFDTKGKTKDDLSIYFRHYLILDNTEHLTNVQT